MEFEGLEGAADDLRAGDGEIGEGEREEGGEGWRGIVVEGAEEGELEGGLSFSGLGLGVSRVELRTTESSCDK